MVGFGIGMAEAFTRTNPVPYDLLQLFYFGKATVFFPVENFFVVETDVEFAAGLAGFEGNGFELCLESGQQLLCNISGAQQPVTFGTISDGDGGLHIECINESWVGAFRLHKFTDYSSWLMKKNISAGRST